LCTPPVAEGGKLSIKRATPAARGIPGSPATATAPAASPATTTTSSSATSAAGPTAARTAAAAARSSEAAPIVEAKAAVRASRAESAHSQGVGTQTAVLHQSVADAHQSQVPTTRAAGAAAAAVHPISARLLIGRRRQPTAHTAGDQVRIAAIAGAAQVRWRFGSGRGQRLLAFFGRGNRHILEAGPLLLGIPPAPPLRGVRSLTARRALPAVAASTLPVPSARPIALGGPVGIPRCG
jgi:hypothetical protein